MVIEENGLIRQPRLTSKFLTLQTGKQRIAIHRSKQDNEICSVIRVEPGNYSFQKSCRKWGRETNSRPCSKTLNWEYL